VSDLKGGHLLEIEELDLAVLDLDAKEVDRPKEYLERLEKLHKSITLYLWLSYRYEGIFTSQALAFHTKALVEEKISEQLDRVDYRPDRRRLAAKLIREASQNREQPQQDVLQGLEEPDGRALDSQGARILEELAGGAEQLEESTAAP
jgi:ATP-dependent RNA helicase SUPV3L1/SUV3